VESTRITVFHVIWLIVVSGVAVVGWVAGGYFGLTGSVASTVFSAFLAHIACRLFMDTLHRRWCDRLSQMTNEDLRAIVAHENWNFEHTMALLNLSARGEEVRCELPRILAMLESESVLTRRYGWDAVRLVFNDETQRLGDYDPRSSTADCQKRVAALRT
jgi:hypothetical protein